MRKVILAVFSAAFITSSCLASGLDSQSPDFRVRVDSIREKVGTRQLQASAYADGFFEVIIADSDQVPLFESNYPIKKEDGSYLEWTYHGESPITMSNKIGSDVFPTLQGMTFAAKDIVRMNFARPGTRIEEPPSSQ